MTLTPENIEKMSKAILEKGKELIPHYPKCTPEEIFKCMPDFYKLVKEELKLLPKEITYEQFHEAAAFRFQMMQHLSAFGFF